MKVSGFVLAGLVAYGVLSACGGGSEPKAPEVTPPTEPGAPPADTATPSSTGAGTGTAPTGPGATVPGTSGPAPGSTSTITNPSPTTVMDAGAKKPGSK